MPFLVTSTCEFQSNRLLQRENSSVKFSTAWLVERASDRQPRAKNPRGPYVLVQPLGSLWGGSYRQTENTDKAQRILLWHLSCCNKSPVAPVTAFSRFL